MSPHPLYVQVRDTLKDRILKGAYPTHDQLPSESKIMSEFGVSRVTVRQAIRDLQDRGMVTSHQGKGTFVNKLKVIRNLGRLEGVGEAAARMDLEAYSDVLSAGAVAANKAVAEALALDSGSNVFEIKRVRFVNNRAVSLDESYYGMDVGQELMKHDLSTQDIFPLLEDVVNLSLSVADLVIEVTAPTDEAARYLCDDDGVRAVVRVERLVHTEHMKPVVFEYISERLDAYRYQLRTCRW